LNRTATHHKVNRGQIFSTDFMVGLVVVLFVLTTIQVYHSQVLEDVKQEEELIYRDSIISRTDTLMLFEGHPLDWHSDNVNILGFSTGTPNKLNRTKLLEYFEMPGDDALELLNFHGRDFYISLVDDNGEIVSYNNVEFERGDRGGWEDSENVHTVERKASLDGKPGIVFLKVVVW